MSMDDREEYLNKVIYPEYDKYEELYGRFGSKDKEGMDNACISMMQLLTSSLRIKNASNRLQL